MRTLSGQPQAYQQTKSPEPRSACGCTGMKRIFLHRIFTGR
jgi:hypothetical protein